MFGVSKEGIGTRIVEGDALFQDARKRDRFVACADLDRAKSLLEERVTRVDAALLALAGQEPGATHIPGGRGEVRKVVVEETLMCPFFVRSRPFRLHRDRTRQPYRFGPDPPPGSQHVDRVDERRAEQALTPKAVQTFRYCRPRRGNSKIETAELARPRRMSERLYDDAPCDAVIGRRRFFTRQQEQWLAQTRVFTIVAEPSRLVFEDPPREPAVRHHADLARRRDDPRQLRAVNEIDTRHARQLFVAEGHLHFSGAHFQRLREFDVDEDVSPGILLPEFALDLEL